MCAMASRAAAQSPFAPAERPPEAHAPTLMRYIDHNVVGKNHSFPGPFGERKVIYCDYTASGRALSFIEEYILNHVLPSYGNTHTTNTYTAMQSTLYREEARDTVRAAVRASEEDVVLFVGHGATAAVHKLIHGLALTKPPIVFVGPWEHHSNLLPWQDIGSMIIRIPESVDGILDLDELEHQLRLHQNIEDDVRLIGCFSAASNITGNLADDVATTLMLHQYGALAFWDYATAAPYVTLDMNPFMPGICETNANKDAIFFSGHKFIGGVQSPGILIAKKNLFQIPVPEVCGGGTVSFVSQDGRCYLKDPEIREEVGTGAIIESIRAGLAIQLKQNVGTTAIMEREEEIVKMVQAHIRTIPAIILLGSSANSIKRLPVFSILVRHPRGMFLHHNFVCAVLNDMFGIQARGGCACAGPYAQDLLGIYEDLANKYDEVLLEDSSLDRLHMRRKGGHSRFEILRPGFTRLSLPYFMSDKEIAFVLESLKMVATEGWKLLPQYVLNPETGEWRYQSNTSFRERKWLSSIRYTEGKMTVHERKPSYAGAAPLDFNECLRIARNYFNKARKIAQKHPLTDHQNLFNGDLSNLRWFMLPSEAQDLLLHHSQNVKQTVPFNPVHYVPLSRQSSISQQGNIICKPMVQRQRSDSHSSTLPNSVFSCVSTPRERCHSLGSTMLKDVLHSKHHEPMTSFTSSCGSQTDISNIELVSSVDSTDGRSVTPTPQAYLTTNTPELLKAYVQGVTEELATEIKSELRGVIAQVEDVLTESGCESDSIDYGSQNCAERGTELMCKNRPDTPRTSIPKEAEDILATQLSEYLVGFTTEVVSEMKSELREVVNAVDDLMSPMGDCSKLIAPQQLSSGVNKDGLTSLKQIKFKLDSNGENAKCNCLPNISQDIPCHKNALSSIKSFDSSQFAPINKSSIEIPTCASQKKTVKPNWLCPGKNIWKPTSQAIKEFEMIKEGDRILVCLSGGKDSLSLLHTLHQYQLYMAAKGVSFELAAVTVHPKTSVYYPKQLIPYLEGLGVHHLYEEQNILDQGLVTESKPLCRFCSQMKRGRLYATARKHNYNVLAMGQNLDDVAESFLMSTFHSGKLCSMKANFSVRERDISVIRPFIYVRECNLRKFAESNNLLAIPENCASCLSASKERNRMKQMLAQQEILFPKLFLSIKAAIKPLISIRYADQENTRCRELLSSTASEDYDNS